MALNSAVEQQITQVSSSTFRQMQQMNRSEVSQQANTDMMTLSKYGVMTQANTLSTYQNGSTYTKRSGMATLYGDIALPDHLLMDYFSQVRGKQWHFQMADSHSGCVYIIALINLTWKLVQIWVQESLLQRGLHAVSDMWFENNYIAPIPGRE